MKKHSRFGASSIERVARCPGSVRMIEALGPLADVTSIYAREGTVAHLLSERCLKAGTDAYVHMGETIDDIIVTEEMVEAVQVYLDFIRGETFLGGTGEIDVEVRLDLRDLHPELYGTADAVIKGRSKLTVVDLKFGKGVAVEVKENRQLKFYGLGAWRTLDPEDRVLEIELVVVQPRAPHRDGPVRRWTMSADDLVAFGTELVEIVQAAEVPDAPLHPSDLCRFCPAQADCPALRQLALSTAIEDFSDKPRQVDELTPDELGVILTKIDIIDGWARACEQRALELLRRGTAVPGWKLVEKRAVRSWVQDDEKTAKKLLELGAPKDKLHVIKLVSPSQAERLLPYHVVKELKPLIQRVSGGTTIAPEADRRPAVPAGAAVEFTRGTILDPAPAGDGSKLFG